MKKSKNIFKYLIGLITVILLRLIPHPPNIEPVTSSLMPFSKKFGWLSGLIFGIISVVAYDLITGTLGVWTIVTAGCFGLLGLFAGFYFKGKENKIRHYMVFSIIGTLIYDAITGIGTGMLFFHQSFAQTFYGQIPFTAMHLLGNVVLAIIVSPLIYRWIVNNPQLETNKLLTRFSSKI